MCNWSMKIDGKCPDPHAPEDDPHVLLDRLLDQLKASGQTVATAQFTSLDTPEG